MQEIFANGRIVELIQLLMVAEAAAPLIVSSGDLTSLVLVWHDRRKR